MEKSPLPEEQTYIHLVSSGNKQAFTVIFKHYSNLIFSFAARFTGSDDLALQITQEVFLKIWVNRKLLSSVLDFEAYISQITRIHTLNILKSLRTETTQTEISANGSNNETESKTEPDELPAITLEEQRTDKFLSVKQQTEMFGKILFAKKVTRHALKTRWLTAVNTISTIFRSASTAGRE